MINETLMIANGIIFVVLVFIIFHNQSTKKLLGNIIETMMTKEEVRDSEKAFTQRFEEMYRIPVKTVVMEKGKYQDEKVIEWLRYVDEEPSLNKKTNILRVVFSQYTSDCRVFQKYIEILDQLMVNTQGSIDIIKKKKEVLDTYLLFCEPDEYNEVNKVQNQNKNDYEKAYVLRRDLYFKSQSMLLGDIQSVVDKIEGKNISANDAYAEIKKIDEQLNKKFIETSELNTIYQKLVEKILSLKDIKHDEQVEYNSKILNQTEEIYKEFNESRNAMNKAKKMAKDIGKKFVKNSEQDETEDVSEIMMSRILELEGFDVELLFEEMLRYLTVTRNEIFSKLSREDKLIFTKHRLTMRQVSDEKS